MYYYGARYYDATIGRFISPDTIIPYPFNPQSLNRYSYCRNNPLKLVDPSGHYDGFDETTGEYTGLACDSGKTLGFDYDTGEYTGLFDPGPSLPIAPTQQIATAAPEPSIPSIVAGVGGAAVAGGIEGSAGITWGEVVGTVAGWAGVAGSAIAAAALVIMTSIPTDSPRNNTSYSESGKDTVQTGGNTVKDGTARALNDYSGKNLSPQEWGDAVEGLKDDKGIPNDSHGKIQRDGSYVDGKGQYRGNINDYIP